MADQGVNNSFIPPHSAEAEKAVLGAVLRDPENLIQVENMIESKHFFLDAHQKIYQAITSLSTQNETPDILTVADKLRGLDGGNEYLGPAYLVELTESCPISQNVEYYARIVRTDYYRRRIIASCQETIKGASNFDGSVESFIENVEKEFLSIAQQYDRKGIIPLRDVLDSTIDEIEQRLKRDEKLGGVPSGFYDLDNLLGGFQKGDLIIVAARPGMGKTAFAVNCAVAAAKSGKNAVIFTLEMRKEELMMRVISGESRVDSSKLRRGDLSEEEGDRIAEGARRIYSINSNLGIDETPAITMMELRSRCRRFKKESSLDLIVIDYLQLIGSSSNKRTESREREISEISMALKALAKELDVPVIALSQLNRSPDFRTDKRPRMSDLRESGSIEQDSDLILFLYRDEQYNPSSEFAGTAELIVGKNRHGATTTIKLAFQPNFLMFQNLYPKSV